MKQISCFIKENRISYKHQYGFRDNLSTDEAVRKCHEISLENKKKKQFLVVVAVDLRKAVESVRFDVLLFKL